MKIRSLVVTAVLATAVLCFGGVAQVQAAACSPTDAACLTNLLSQLQTQLSQLPVTTPPSSQALMLQIDILQTQLELQQLQGTTQPSITVTSPNGGEVWQIGTSQTIQYSTSTNMPGAGTCVDSYAVDSNGNKTPLTVGNYIGIQNALTFQLVPDNSNNIFNGAQVLAGTYKIELDVHYCAETNNAFITSGTSNGYITIVAATQTTDNSALIAQLQAEIQSLMQQIAALQGQQGTTQTWCHTFTKYLVAGSTDATTGGEVSDLQIALDKATSMGLGNAIPDVSGIFDDSTAATVVQFQGTYGITQTGTVGPKTRAKLNSLYGCRNTVCPLYVTQVCGSDGNTYSGNSCLGYGMPSGVTVASQGACITKTAQPSITVTSPNGGEQWVLGTKQTVSYSISSNMPHAGVCMEAYAVDSNGNKTDLGGGMSVSTPITVDLGTGISIHSVNLTPGNYKIEIDASWCAETTTGLIASDTSDNYFTIVAPTTTTCTDSDADAAHPSGLNYYVKGNMSFKFPDGLMGVSTDTCFTTGNRDSTAPAECLGSDGTGNGKCINESYCPSPTQKGYIITLCPNGCSDGACITSSSTQPSITVTSPNGGETYKIGDTIPIKFSTNIPENQTPNGVTLQLYRAQKGTPGYVSDIIKNYIAGSPYNWTIPSSLAPDLYYIYASATVTGISLPEGGVSDFSDNYFTIVAQGSNLTPVINGISAPTTLNIGQTGTWTVNASDPQNGQLSYSVSWGDTLSAATVSGNSANQSFVQTSTFTHSYSSTGIYTVAFTVKNSAGLTAQTSSTVQIGNSTQPSITVTSPNGGETILLGASGGTNDFRTTWTSSNLSGNVSVYLNFTDGRTCLLGTAPVSQGYFLTTLGNNYQCPNIPISVTPGQYKVFLNTDTPDTTPNSLFGIHDSSDNYFIIVAPTTIPSINSILPTSGLAGSSITINGSGFNSGDSIHLTSGSVGQYVTPSSITASQLTFNLPAGIPPTGYNIVNILVHYGPISSSGVPASGGLDSNSVTFTVTSTTQPSITSISPTSGVAGSSITINGTGLDGSDRIVWSGYDNAGAGYGLTLYPTSATPMQIIFSAPTLMSSSNSGTFNVYLQTVNNKVSNTVQFTIVAPTTGGGGGQTITCSTNSQCGTNGVAGSSFCQGNNVYQSYTTYTCNNPGTASSSCTSSTTPQLQNTCVANQTCTNGSCAIISSNPPCTGMTWNSTIINPISSQYPNGQGTCVANPPCTGMTWNSTIINPISSQYPNGQGTCVGGSTQPCPSGQQFLSQFNACIVSGQPVCPSGQTFNSSLNGCVGNSTALNVSQNGLASISNALAKLAAQIQSMFK